MTTNLITDEPLLSDVVATRVRGQMAEKRVSQTELAHVLRVAPSAVSDRLRGVKPINLNEVPLLAEHFGVSIEYLLGLTEARGGDAPTSEYVHLRPLADVLRFPIERVRSAA